MLVEAPFARVKVKSGRYSMKGYLKRVFDGQMKRKRDFDGPLFFGVPILNPNPGKLYNGTSRQETRKD